VAVSGLPELVGLALGEVGTAEALGAAAQATQAGMAGGCVVYMPCDAEAEAAASSAGSCGLGLECVVGWKTAGPKLMVFVGKPFRQLATERRAAFGLGGCA
jgi:hypothetical protein